MSNMHEIKQRMKSIKETRQITKAMKLISAAKLKKARQLLEQTLPYFDKVRLTMEDILMHSTTINSPFFDKRDSKAVRKKGFIILSGDKGLSGGYNNSIIKFAERSVCDDSDCILFVAGQVGRNYFIKKGYNVDPHFDYMVQNPSMFTAREISEFIIDKFLTGEFDEIHIIYTLMTSSIKIEPHVMMLLPLDLDAIMEDLNMKNVDDGNVQEYKTLIYEPSPEAVFNILVSKYVKGVIYGALVEAFTSEQSSRMTAMDNATASADEMLHKLNLHYNRARQAAITQEISEIVGGAAALQ
jgi:F-type H+-transporting ATPase subunit gamma